MKHYRILHMSDILRESAPIGAPNEEKETKEMKETKDSKKTKIYKCPYCGNTLMVIEDGGVTPVCCGGEMEVLEEDSPDGSNDESTDGLTDGSTDELTDRAYDGPTDGSTDELTDELKGGGKHAERQSKRFACFTGK